MTTCLAGFPYIFRWNRQGRKGQQCRLTARGKMNSIRVEFADGFIMITSGNAIRKAVPASRNSRTSKQSDGVRS